MSKHIDVIALLLIVLGLLAFSKVPELRMVRTVSASEFRIPTAPAVKTDCPLTKALTLLFR